MLRSPAVGCLRQSGQEPAAAVDYAVDGDAQTMSMDSAFWVWNLVANLAYGERYNVVMPLVQEKIHFYQDRFFEATAKIDKQAEALLTKDPSSPEALELITRFGVETGEQMTKDWRNFWMQLFSTVRDGYTVGASKKKQCVGKARKDCTSRNIPDTVESGYSKAWYTRIVKDSDNAQHYHVPDATDAAESAASRRKILRMDKMRESTSDDQGKDSSMVV